MLVSVPLGQGRRRLTSSSEVNDMERDYDIFERLPDASVRCLVRVHGTLHVPKVLEERGKQTTNECFAMNIKTQSMTRPADKTLIAARRAPTSPRAYLGELWPKHFSTPRFPLNGPTAS